MKRFETSKLLAVVVVAMLLAWTSGANAELIAHYTFDSDFTRTVGVVDGTGHDDAVISTSIKKLGAGSLKLDGGKGIGESGGVMADVDYVDFGDNYDFGTDDFSIAMWVKLVDKNSTSTLDRHQLVHKQASSGYYGGVAMFVEHNGKLAGYMREAVHNPDSVESFSVGTVDDDAWHHVAWTADRDGNMVLYVDGVGTTGAALSSIGDVSSAVNFDLGRNAGNAYRATEGYIDDFRIYNHVLSSDEINALVPEPGTLVLLATGLIGLLCYAWRRRK